MSSGPYIDARTRSVVRPWLKPLALLASARIPAFAEAGRRDALLAGLDEVDRIVATIRSAVLSPPQTDHEAQTAAAVAAIASRR